MKKTESMSVKRTLVVAGQVALVVALLALVVGHALGQPVLLSFVETGSMQPTMDPGDGFIAVPGALAGSVSTGDVVTFDAQEIEGGGLTTHRVVDETERGYITQGDDNPFTDQDGGEPVVQDADIVAVALSVGGSVVVIPHLGTVAMAFQGALDTAQTWAVTSLGFHWLQGTQGLAYALFGLSMVAYAADWYLTGNSRDRPERETDRDAGTSVRFVLVALACVLMITATAAMVVPGGSHEYGVVSADFESDNPTVIERGESETIEYPVPNAGLVPVHAYVEPASAGVETGGERISVGARDEAIADVTLTAPDETGYYRMHVVEHRYLALLPGGLIDDLYGLHPWAPLIAINALLGGGVYALGALLVRGESARLRTRQSRERAPLTRRLLRELYK